MPESPKLNMENAGLKKAMELISFDNLTPEERAQAKNQEAKKITLAKLRKVDKLEIAQNCVKEGMEDELIVRITKLSLSEVQNIRKELS